MPSDSVSTPSQHSFTASSGTRYLISPSPSTNFNQSRTYPVNASATFTGFAPIASDRSSGDSSSLHPLTPKSVPWRRHSGDNVKTLAASEVRPTSKADGPIPSSISTPVLSSRQIRHPPIGTSERTHAGPAVRPDGTPDYRAHLKRSQTDRSIPSLLTPEPAKASAISSFPLKDIPPIAGKGQSYFPGPADELADSSESRPAPVSKLPHSSSMVEIADAQYSTSSASIDFFSEFAAKDAQLEAQATSFITETANPPTSKHTPQTDRSYKRRTISFIPVTVPSARKPVVVSEQNPALSHPPSRDDGSESLTGHDHINCSNSAKKMTIPKAAHAADRPLPTDRNPPSVSATNEGRLNRRAAMRRRSLPVQHSLSSSATPSRSSSLPQDITNLTVCLNVHDDVPPHASQDNPKTWTSADVSMYLAWKLDVASSFIRTELSELTQNSRLAGRTFLRLRAEDIAQLQVNARWKRSIQEAVRSLRASYLDAKFESNETLSRYDVMLVEIADEEDDEEPRSIPSPVAMKSPELPNPVIHATDVVQSPVARKHRTDECPSEASDDTSLESLSDDSFTHTAHMRSTNTRSAPQPPRTGVDSVTREEPSTSRATSLSSTAEMSMTDIAEVEDFNNPDPKDWHKTSHPSDHENVLLQKQIHDQEREIQSLRARLRRLERRDRPPARAARPERPFSSRLPSFVNLPGFVLMLTVGTAMIVVKVTLSSLLRRRRNH